MTDIASTAHFAAPDVQIEKASETGDFRIGRVFDGVISVLRQHMLAFFAVSAIAYVPIALLVDWTSATDSIAEMHAGAIAWLAITGLLGWFAGVFAQAVIYHGAYQHLCGRRVSLGESVQACSRRFLTIILLVICIAILTFLAALAFVIPALIVSIMWYVAVPACVVETLGINASLTRSAELTKGHRWKVFGLMLVIGLVSSIVNAMIGGIQYAVHGEVFQLVTGVIQYGLVGTISTVAMLVAYRELRVAKEGPDMARIATVFA
jgi:MFS family permease